MKGLLVDFGGVLTTNVFDSFSDFCVAEGLEAEAFLDLFRSNPEARRELRRVETGEIDEDEFAEILGGMLGVEDRVDLVNRLFAGMRADEPMVEAVRTAKASRHADRPDLELDRRRAVRPQHVPRDVRRRGDLRRGRHAQAQARDLPPGRRARGPAAPRSACSWTTCGRTAREPRPWA